MTHNRKQRRVVGFTDHVFGLCHLLGFRFAPRIRDLADRRLYVPDKAKLYPSLLPFIGGTINLKQILAQWPEILRLASSIRIGSVTSSLILRKTGKLPAAKRSRSGIARIWTYRTDALLHALTPLIYTHVTPYGIFRLDMNQRLAIEEDAVAA